MEIGAPLPHLVSEAVLKRFDLPDEVRDMTLGRFEVVRLGGMTIGRAICLPGWRWSEHVGPRLGQERCRIEQLGLILGGAVAVGFPSGRISVMRAGDLFYVPPEPHDSWVIGEHLLMALHFLGTELYAKSYTRSRV